MQNAALLYGEGGNVEAQASVVWIFCTTTRPIQPRYIL